MLAVHTPLCSFPVPLPPPPPPTPPHTPRGPPPFPDLHGHATIAYVCNVIIACNASMHTMLTVTDCLLQYCATPMSMHVESA